MTQNRHRTGGFSAVGVLVVIAIIAILIGAVLPEVQELCDSADRAKEWPELVNTCAIVLLYVHNMGANLERADALFDNWHDVLQNPQEIAELRALIAKDKSILQEAYRLLPELGPNADPEFVRAYEDLRGWLIKVITKQHYIQGYLAALQSMLATPA